MDKRLTGVVAIAVACRSTSAFAQLRAFGEAEGFGASASGGRAGNVVHVTNLNDSGAGSFRDAVSVSNRIVVFDLGGYINLTSAVSVKSNITILGQTAPGDGIGIMGREVSFNGASNDVVRYVRFRQGDLDPDNQKSGINLLNATSVMLDHVSIEFAQWNNIDAVGADQITVQNSIIANPIGQQFNAHTETLGGSFTWTNNIFANAHNRSPLAKINTQYVNNVVYNYQAGYTAGNSGSRFSHDVINNYFITGPSTTSSNNDYYQVGANQKAYAIGNVLDANDDGVLNGSADNSLDGAVVLTAPWSATTAALPTLSAAAGFLYATSHAGANLHGYDQVDAQVIANVASLGTTGQMWSHQTSTGLANSGYGALNDGAHIVDANGNGIADGWETAHGLALNDTAGYKKLNPLGYTMLEQYANELADTTTQRTWSAAGGNWTAAGTNWAGGSGAPGIFETALVRGTGVANGVVTVSQTSGATAMRVSIGGNGPAAGESLIVNSGGALSVYDTVVVGERNHALFQINAGGTASAYNVILGKTTNGVTYNGTLALNGGVLRTSQIAVGGGTPGNWNSGGVINWSGGTVLAAADLSISAPAVIGGSGATVDTNGFDGVVSGVFAGSGPFVKSGAGSLVVTANHTYTGQTIVRGGFIGLAGSVNGTGPGPFGSTTSAAGNLVLDGGGLQFAGGTTGASTDRLFTLTPKRGTLDSSGGGTFNFSSTGAIAVSSAGAVTLTLTGANTGHNTFAPALADGTNGAVLNVSKTGAGKWTFSSGAKTYSGLTHVIAGTLETLTTNALSPNSDVTIDAGATLDFHNNSQVIDGLAGAGLVTNSFSSTNARTLTIGANNGGGTFTGTVASGLPMNLVKVGTGTQAFTSAAFPGSLAVNGGVVNLGGSNGLTSPLSAITLTVSNGASVNLLPTPTNTNRVLTNAVTSLQIAAGGTVSIGNHNLYVDAAATPLSMVQAYLLSGRNGGNWKGPGLTSVTVAADAAHLGLAFASGTSGVSSGGLAGEILIRPALIGDSNLDGAVDNSDVSQIVARGHYLDGTTTNSWVDGDFNADGQVTNADVSMLIASGNYLAGTAFNGEPGQLMATFAALPEPTAVTVWIIGAASLTARRRRRSVYPGECARNCTSVRAKL